MIFSIEVDNMFIFSTQVTLIIYFFHCITLNLFFFLILVQLRCYISEIMYIFGLMTSFYVSFDDGICRIRKNI